MQKPCHSRCCTQLFNIPRFLAGWFTYYNPTTMPFNQPQLQPDVLGHALHCQRLLWRQATRKGGRSMLPAGGCNGYPSISTDIRTSFFSHDLARNGGYSFIQFQRKPYLQYIYIHIIYIYIYIHAYNNIYIYLYIYIYILYLIYNI